MLWIMAKKSKVLLKEEKIMSAIYWVSLSSYRRKGIKCSFPRVSRFGELNWTCLSSAATHQVGM